VISPAGIRDAIRRGTITPVRVDGRTNMLTREEVERYRREHRGQRGKRKQPEGALTEKQRKQRAYQHAQTKRNRGESRASGWNCSLFCGGTLCGAVARVIHAGQRCTALEYST
jgi:hypothetical protein